MAEFFVVRLGERSIEAVGWIVVDDEGTRRGEVGHGTLVDAAIAAGERPTIVLVPGTEVLTAYTSIPAKGARLLAALPFALEDQLADDVDDLHFAPGKRHESGRLPVAIVARNRVQAWLDALSEAGLRATRMVPENHGLAQIPNTLSMLVTGDRVMFNDGDEVEFVIPGLSPAEALATTGVLGERPASSENASRHLLVYCDAGLDERYQQDWALLRQELDSMDLNVLPDGVLPKLAVTVASGTGINLLQGDFGDKTRFGASLRPWRYAAGLLAGLLLVGLVGRGVDYYRLSNERDTLQAQFTEEYRRLRPNDDREIADPVGTVESLRRSQGASAAGPQVFLPLMQSLADAIKDSEAVEVEAVSYRAGVVDVRLNAPDIPALDQVVQNIDATGRFTASLQSADSVGDRVNSRIQIRESGS
jgi:general secretion pathway protein L